MKLKLLEKKVRIAIVEAVFNWTSQKKTRNLSQLSRKANISDSKLRRLMEGKTNLSFVETVLLAEAMGRQNLVWEAKEAMIL
jgi:DNA-binding phage protein